MVELSKLPGYPSFGLIVQCERMDKDMKIYIIRIQGLRIGCFQGIEEKKKSQPVFVF